MVIRGGYHHLLKSRFKQFKCSIRGSRSWGGTKFPYKSDNVGKKHEAVAACHRGQCYQYHEEARVMVMVRVSVRVRRASVGMGLGEAQG